MKLVILSVLALSSALVCAEPQARIKAPIQVSELVDRDDTPLDRSGASGALSYARSLDKARPAVVSVFSTSQASVPREQLLFQYLFGEEPDQAPRPQLGLGSGVIISEDGYILTNHHVVSGASEIRVQLDDRSTHEATLIGFDEKTDIAVIKIEAEGLSKAVFTDSQQIEVGDVVFAIGNPLGVGKTVTMGIVSAIGSPDLSLIREGYEDFIQTDAPINTGNSGGALVDARGRLIGINTMIHTDGRSTGNIGIGFAVPVNLAYSVMTDLIESGAVMRGFLGVGIEALDRDKAEFFGIDGLGGALVNQVSRGTPAEAAGLKAGDVIVSVDGKPIPSPNALRLTISQMRPGTSISLGIIREKKRIDISATLIQIGEQGQLIGEIKPAVWLEGVTAETVTDELRGRFKLDPSVEGIVVTEVASGSPYAGQLPPGMVIQKVNGQEVGSVPQAAGLLQRDSKNMMQVSYRGVYRWISIEVK